MAEVTIEVGGDRSSPAITKHSIQRLGLASATTWSCSIKSTEVMLAK